MADYHKYFDEIFFWQEIQLTLQQQQPILDDLSSNVVRLRQHVAGTRFNVAHHSDMDQMENDVQLITVRWENICSNVVERCKNKFRAVLYWMVHEISSWLLD